MIRRAAGEVVFLAVLAGLIWVALELVVLKPLDVAVAHAQRIERAASCACRPVLTGRSDCEAVIRDVLRRNPGAIERAEQACLQPAPQATPGVWH